ncbi:quercetin 2,3-dioxygenase [Spirosoma fluviale]|uniref:Quercetin 2,3-dioxygenase n=1 Tax=Spirosoma fluviale TaxID=1597977 RepID=A0A286GBB3_9BACT|nr:quercetin 2,3-dioxygenase [Spirosoma fluviale]SOD92807.1 quercetin 2,3-dioxygenase [Spirosoma fluviale]
METSTNTNQPSSSQEHSSIADTETLQKGAEMPGGLEGVQAIEPKGELPGQKIPYFIRSGDGERYLVGSLVINLTARGVDTGDLYEWTVITGGKGAVMPSHVHHTTHEALFVVDGEVELWLDGQTYRLGKGDFASIPPSVSHAFRTNSHRTQLISISSGPLLSAMYKAIGTPYAGYVQPGDAIIEPDAERLKAAEEVADVLFDGKPLDGQTFGPVTNTTVPNTVVPYVLAAGEGDRYTLGDQLFSIMSDNASTNGKLLVVMTEGPAGDMIGKHYHREHTEMFCCVDGMMSMWLNKSLLDIHPGDYVAVPAGAIHAYQLRRNYTRFVGMLTPGIFEDFFRSAHPYQDHVYPQIPSGGPNFAKVSQLDLVLLERPGPLKH